MADDEDMPPPIEGPDDAPPPIENLSVKSSIGETSASAGDSDNDKTLMQNMIDEATIAKKKKRRRRRSFAKKQISLLAKV